MHDGFELYRGTILIAVVVTRYHALSLTRKECYDYL
jgi:hypothetical protein